MMPVCHAGQPGGMLRVRGGGKSKPNGPAPQGQVRGGRLNRWRSGGPASSGVLLEVGGAEPWPYLSPPAKLAAPLAPAVRLPPSEREHRMNDLFGAGGEKRGDSYSAKDIEVLEGLEPVRRRPGMYIGGTDENALHHLAAEILDNAMDEAVAGHASFIEMSLEAGNFLLVRDNGRGIPVDPASEISQAERAGGYSHHAAFRRQILRQGL